MFKIFKIERAENFDNYLPPSTHSIHEASKHIIARQYRNIIN